MFARLTPSGFGSRRHRHGVFRHRPLGMALAPLVATWPAGLCGAGAVLLVPPLIWAVIALVAAA